MQLEGTFVWESGQPLCSDVGSHWDINEPNNFANGDCVQVGNSGNLYDIGCIPTIKAKIVCQKQLRGLGKSLQPSHMTLV